MAQYLNPFPSGYVVLNDDGTNSVQPHTNTTTQYDKLNEMILHTTTNGDAAPIHLTPEQVEDRNRQWLLNYHPKYKKSSKVKESFMNMKSNRNILLGLLVLLVLIIILYSNKFKKVIKKILK